ncbi:MAG: class I SAM-dependent DNA methyltransferase [Verrucomicrobia bacterium]|nr:class I SAM-dependent DNA methyltransferase [Verrucomicrobiota bacterium]
MTAAQQQAAAKAFVQDWRNQGRENAHSQPFWLTLLQNVYGVEHPENFISFEDPVNLDNTSFIDGRIPSTRVLIEQKSLGRSLEKPLRQSDGTYLTPFQQAKRYGDQLKVSEHPRWIVVCNFETFHVYNMDVEPVGTERTVIQLKNLEKEYHQLNFLINDNVSHLAHEQQVSTKAGDLIGQIYDALHNEYNDPENPKSLKSLNELCVRLVFCFYAEDTILFGKRNLFFEHMSRFTRGNDFRNQLLNLFKILDTKEEERDIYETDLTRFPYVNGGLFANRNIEIPQITNEIRNLILFHASQAFDWSGISPTIFGSVFESTLNPVTRREGGMHYTSVENIHKVIDPLFLTDLRKELDKISAIHVIGRRKRALKEFQEKLGSLTFFDPACGSGNFLTETYISLRRLENRALELLYMDDEDNFQMQMDLGNIIKVSIDHFYGIEINDFAVTVAKTALWIAESQMMLETERIIHQNLDFLPLRTSAHIIEGNALQMNWEDVVPKDELNYIISNPPFIGARVMNKEQKKDVRSIFNGWANVGNLDYVSCWYKMAVDYMQGTQIRTALVGTNSITQGEAVSNLWKPLLLEMGVHIDFAYRTFRWDSEANIPAQVHCVIIGFSLCENPGDKIIYDGDKSIRVNHINAYLEDGEDIYVGSRNEPISAGIPKIGMGNQPIDDGNYLFKLDEMKAFIKKEPESEKYFHPWYGSQEFISRKPRYCLWLGECPPEELEEMPLCKERVDAVHQYRLNSKREATVRLANTPTRFQTENMPEGNYIVIPEVSSERRKYIPIGYMDDSVLCSNKLRLMPNAGLYHFGILNSSVHMGWMRTVTGRLEMRYSYSVNIVYNNFPWPSPSNEQKEKIEETAQAILDARAKHPKISLAKMYTSMHLYPELLEAHGKNDKAVMEAYGFSKDMTEPEIVSELMKMYQVLDAAEKQKKPAIENKKKSSRKNKM